MTVDTRAVMQRLLTSSAQAEPGAKLDSIIESLIRFDPTAVNSAKALATIACLTQFNRDGRTLPAAISLLEDLGFSDQLENMLVHATAYGQIQSVFMLSQTNQVDFSYQDFVNWLKSFGIKWFDMYRDSDNGLVFMSPEDEEFLRQIIYSEENFWQEILPSLDDDQTLSEERRQLLRLFASGKEPVCEAASTSRTIDQRFQDYCFEHGLQILRQLQQGQDEIKRCSSVYLVRDVDGIVKIFKEVLDYNNERLSGLFSREDQIYTELPEHLCLPRYYGKLEIDNDLIFMKMSVHYSQSLSDYCHPDRLLDSDDVCSVILRLAKHLHWLHRQNVLHLDLKPGNVMTDGREVYLLDLGVSRKVSDITKPVPIVVADPRYVTPEGIIKLEANAASEVFQLGLIFYELLTGKHAFAIDESYPETSREELLLKYSWPIAGLNFRNDIDIIDDPRLDMVTSMLHHDPAARPTLPEVISALNTASNDFHFVQKRKSVPRKAANNTILFPARMGMPHKGHIEYISRLLQLGYYVKISLQRSYTLTDRDPLPKWVVMKMVAQSLFDKGFTSRDFSFIFTPFYETDREMAMHFAMMPDREHIVGVASSNHTIWKFFQGFDIFDQISVFALEEEEYQVRSWGENLRRSVRERDRRTFNELACSGMEKLSSFQALRQDYPREFIDFVHGKTRIVLLSKHNDELIRSKAFKYLSPVQCLVRQGLRDGLNLELVDLYSKNAQVRMNGISAKWQYRTMIFEKLTGDLTLYFNCIT